MIISGFLFFVSNSNLERYPNNIQSYHFDFLRIKKQKSGEIEQRNFRSIYSKNEHEFIR